MAPLPQSNTERWWAVYQVNNTEHRLGVRTADGVTAAQISPIFGTLFNNLAALRFSTAVLGLERALKGSNVRVPFSYTGPAPGGAGTAVGDDGRARTISFTGRSLDGRKTKLFMFGIKFITQGDYRLDAAESVEVAQEVAHLNNASGVFLSISGLQPVWHAYVNVGFNDHWIKQYRKGG